MTENKRYSVHEIAREKDCSVQAVYYAIKKLKLVPVEEGRGMKLSEEQRVSVLEAIKLPKPEEAA